MNNGDKVIVYAPTFGKVFYHRHLVMADFEV